MEFTGRSYRHSPRLDIAYVWKNPSRYYEGHESEVAERTTICECDPVVVFLLLIEEKWPGTKMDSHSRRHMHYIGKIRVDAYDLPSIDRDGD